MAKGSTNGSFEARDRSFGLEEVMSIFQCDQMPNLIGKPKLFFIQSYRGDQYDSGFAPLKSLSCLHEDHEEPLMIPTTVDQLVMYATLGAHPSLSKTIKGSWMIQEICSQFETNVNDDLLSILTTVTRKLILKNAKADKEQSTSQPKYTKQAATIVSSLTKKLYFHKHVDDSNKIFKTLSLKEKSNHVRD